MNGQEQKQEFPKGSAGGFDVTVQSAAEPGAIEFKAYKKGTSTSVLMKWEVEVLADKRRHTMQVCQ